MGKSVYSIIAVLCFALAGSLPAQKAVQEEEPSARKQGPRGL
jgi:hypothetical protein